MGHGPCGWPTGRWMTGRRRPRNLLSRCRLSPWCASQSRRLWASRGPSRSGAGERGRGQGHRRDAELQDSTIASCRQPSGPRYSAGRGREAAPSSLRRARAHVSPPRARARPVATNGTSSSQPPKRGLGAHGRRAQWVWARPATEPPEWPPVRREALEVDDRTRGSAAAPAGRALHRPYSDEAARA